MDEEKMQHLEVEMSSKHGQMILFSVLLQGSQKCPIFNTADSEKLKLGQIRRDV